MRGQEARRAMTSAMEMMDVKVCVSGCGDTAVTVYKYPCPESGVCTWACVCVMGQHECHRELFK